VPPYAQRRDGLNQRVIFQREQREAHRAPPPATARASGCCLVSVAPWIQQGSHSRHAKPTPAGLWVDRRPVRDPPQQHMEGISFSRKARRRCDPFRRSEFRRLRLPRVRPLSHHPGAIKQPTSSAVPSSYYPRSASHPSLVEPAQNPAALISADRSEVWQLNRQQRFRSCRFASQAWPPPRTPHRAPRWATPGQPLTSTQPPTTTDGSRHTSTAGYTYMQ
jgi:hypothetical protein